MAEQLEVSRATVAKWLARYETEGPAVRGTARRARTPARGAPATRSRPMYLSSAPSIVSGRCSWPVSSAWFPPPSAGSWPATRCRPSRRSTRSPVNRSAADAAGHATNAAAPVNCSTST
ncbi:hypothetical protein [Actinomycetospora atypica]|uniref:hypothetical protein n=1 Tax=Actinomycetospora atypica TaxID=1290095 RepID=UPI00366FA022